MSLFALLMMYAYSWGEYAAKGPSQAPFWRPLWDSVNYCEYSSRLMACSR